VPEPSFLFKTIQFVIGKPDAPIRASVVAKVGTLDSPSGKRRGRIAHVTGRFVKLTILVHYDANHAKPGAIIMASGTRNIRMLVNQDCFAFLADAMCEYSKKTARFESLRSTVQHACIRAQTVPLEREDLEQFLARHPVDGKIRVWLEVKPDWIADYDLMRSKIAQISGKRVHDKAVVPFVVYLAQARGLF
jgi:hypothetical protein